MKISALPPKRQNYNSVAFILAAFLYIPLVFGGIRLAGHLNSKTVMNSGEQVVKIMMKTLMPPAPVQEVPVAEPAPVIEEVPVPPEPEIKKPEKRETPPPVSPKKEVKKPKPLKKKKSEPVRRNEKITPPVRENPAAAVPAEKVRAEAVRGTPVQAEKPVTMVFGKTDNELMAQIVKSLKAGLYYPSQARRRGIQGVVLVSFIVGKNGQTRDIMVVRSSSGEEILGQAAMVTVKNASSRFPKTERDIKVVVPIEFRLK